MTGDWFYGEIYEDEVIFSPSESLHLAKVMRKKVGDKLIAFDGQGSVVEVELIHVHPKKSTARIHKLQKHLPTTRSLTLAVAPTKSIDRFEFVLEKGTELGVTHFVPLICFHSERKKINLERCQRIILAAAKQSRKAFLPKIFDLTYFSDWVDGTNMAEKYIAHCNAQFTTKPIQDIPKNQPTCVLIGPEGDFSEKEIQLAMDKGFSGISLTANRLRTETAAIAVAAFWDYTSVQKLNRNYR